MKECETSRKNFRHLEDIGRVRLSKSFLLRDFLYSEIAAAYGLVNAPTDLDLAVDVGSSLCTELLEPIQERFGRISVRSGYRSTEVNSIGHRLGLNCASNKKNAAAHIWDIRDQLGRKGATACIVIPSFWAEYQEEGSWRILADWIDNHLNYSTLVFFPKLWAFNIQWREDPKKIIKSYAVPRGLYGIVKGTGLEEVDSDA